MVVNDVLTSPVCNQTKLAACSALGLTTISYVIMINVMAYMHYAAPRPARDFLEAAVLVADDHKNCHGFTFAAYKYASWISLA